MTREGSRRLQGQAPNFGWQERRRCNQTGLGVGAWPKGDDVSDTRSEKRWVCAHCESARVSLAVMWGDSVEPVDQAQDELGPDGCGPGDVAYLLHAFCDSCCATGEPSAMLKRRRLTPEQAADAELARA